MNSAIVLLLALGALFGCAVTFLIQYLRLRSIRELSSSLLLRAEKEAEKKKKEAQATIEAAKKASDLALENDQKLLKKKLSDCEKREKLLKCEQEAFEKNKKSLESASAKNLAILEKTASLTSSEAKQELYALHEAQIKKELVLYKERQKREIDETLQEEAKALLLGALQRIPPPTLKTATTTRLTQCAPETLSKVIGRDGRNIRAFESLTHTDLIVDESLGSIEVSSFDPERRFIAFLALKQLIESGKINLQRIEEEVARATSYLPSQLIKYGTLAAQKCDLYDLPQPLLEALGRLFLRQSLQQNVLDHSIEVAILSSLIATELGFDALSACRAGLLHDIGKGITTSPKESHATSGALLAQMAGESQKVVNLIASHHNEVRSPYPEAEIIRLSDSLSATRPGARYENVDAHYERLKDLEALAASHPGVAKAYVLQSGRKLQICVRPDEVSDSDAEKLLQTLRTKIASPIQITLIRESKFVNNR